MAGKLKKKDIKENNEKSNTLLDYSNNEEDNTNFNIKDVKIINDERQNWLYYTRAPLMDNYRDNLYREYFSISVLLSLRGEGNEKSLGLSLKLIDIET